MDELLALIKAMRTRLGVAQADLAERAGVSLPTIQNIEAGKANPSAQTLHAILAELGLQLRCVRGPTNWDYLSAFGLNSAALAVTSPAFNAAEFRRQLFLALATLVDGEATQLEFGGRRRRGMAALLQALEEHFPSYYRAHCAKSPLVMDFRRSWPDETEVRVAPAQLRRLAEIL